MGKPNQKAGKLTPPEIHTLHYRQALPFVPYVPPLCKVAPAARGSHARERARYSARVSMETRHLVTLLQAEAPVSLAGVQRFVEALLEEHVTPSTVGEIVLRVHGFLCHAETHLQQAAPQTIAALAATSDDHKCVRDALEKLLVSKVYHRVFGVGEGGRDAALHERLAGLSHLTCVGRLQPAMRCCCRPISNVIFPGRRASESVLRLAKRPSKAGARRSSSSADWGSTVRLKTR